LSFAEVKRHKNRTKARYRGRKKNHEWLLAAIALVNLYQRCKWLVLLGHSISGGLELASRDAKQPR
jgi:hypothetical protein